MAPSSYSPPCASSTSTNNPLIKTSEIYRCRYCNHLVMRTGHSDIEKQFFYSECSEKDHNYQIQMAPILLRPHKNVSLMTYPPNNVTHIKLEFCHFLCSSMPPHLYYTDCLTLNITQRRHCTEISNPPIALF